MPGGGRRASGSANRAAQPPTGTVARLPGPLRESNAGPLGPPA